jgi:hypothetical protein
MPVVLVFLALAVPSVSLAGGAFSSRGTDLEADRHHASSRLLLCGRDYVNCTATD